MDEGGRALQIQVAADASPDEELADLALEALGGLQPGPDRDGKVFVLFGRRPDLVGWAATLDGRPDPESLCKVRHFQPKESDD